jgi:hypothetical protein
MTIVPETKDWTWTISGACPDCGYDGPRFDPTRTSAAVCWLATNFPAALAAHPTPSTRPNPSTWAPVEYACHVRDVFRLYEYRLGLMLNEEGPTFPNWDQDETAITDQYLEQDPVVVGDELALAGHSLAVAFDAVRSDQWLRTGNRSDNKHFTVASFAVYMVHDPAHHYWDITGQAPTLT